MVQKTGVAEVLAKKCLLWFCNHMIINGQKKDKKSFFRKCHFNRFLQTICELFFEVKRLFD